MCKMNTIKVKGKHLQAIFQKANSWIERRINNQITNYAIGHREIF